MVYTCRMEERFDPGIERELIIFAGVREALI
jgi:hypothetical protein